jgi:hypothetical protein
MAATDTWTEIKPTLVLRIGGLLAYGFIFAEA